MTTSGVATYNPVRDKIIRRSLRMIGAFASGDNPTADQLTDAVDVLNAMIKMWQVDGYLWLRTFAELTLVPGQSSYEIGSGTTDVCVYQGTSTSAERPIKIFSATRKDSAGNEVPIAAISRNDYMNLTTKSTTGQVNQYYYDPQTELGKFYVWPAPSAFGDVIVLDMDRPLWDMVGDQNTYDFPSEWMNVLAYGLAVELAPEYGLALNEQALLQQRLAILQNAVLSYNRGNESTFFQVEMR